MSAPEARYPISLDLHLHTAFSDGILDPVDLVEKAYQRGVRILSVTDHDCLAGLSAAEGKARSFGMLFVPGVELNTHGEGEEVHILGYGFDLDNQVLKEALAHQRRDREVRFKKMLEKLNGLGFNLTEASIRRHAKPGSSVGRPHLALALIEKRAVGAVSEAFEKYLKKGRPGWAPRKHMTPKEAIHLILQAGGIPVLAHPARGGLNTVPTLVEWGLKGIEVYYPSHTPVQTKEFAYLADRYHLIKTAGSDYHGINPHETGPGGLQVPQKVIETWTGMIKPKHG